jgi:hypothetical protein
MALDDILKERGSRYGEFKYAQSFSWDDIAGFATLVANRLRSDSSATRTSGEG